jgi:hypothetical protein
MIALLLISYLIICFAGGFDIYNNILVVGVTGLDFETIPFYNISVMSIDNGIPPKSIEVIISFDSCMLTFSEIIWSIYLTRYF